MPADAKTRVRKRIRARLEELNMTGRELADAVPGQFGKAKTDAWISGVLAGTQALALDDFDVVADKLRLSPSDLIRHDDSEVRELRPHEMALLRHYQRWPEQIQERWIRILDYFSAVTPDEDSAKLLDLWKELSLPDRRQLRLYLQQLSEGTTPRRGGSSGGPEGSVGDTGSRGTTNRDRPDQKPNANQTPGADHQHAHHDEPWPPPKKR